MPGSVEGCLYFRAVISKRGGPRRVLHPSTLPLILFLIAYVIGVWSDHTHTILSFEIIWFEGGYFVICGDDVIATSSFSLLWQLAIVEKEIGAARDFYVWYTVGVSKHRLLCRLCRPRVAPKPPLLPRPYPSCQEVLVWHIFLPATRRLLIKFH